MSSLADIHAALAADLLAYRDRHVLTQTELARRLGCSVRSVQDYEAGKALPRAALRRRITALLAGEEQAA